MPRPPCYNGFTKNTKQGYSAADRRSTRWCRAGRSRQLVPLFVFSLFGTLNASFRPGNIIRDRRASCVADISNRSRQRKRRSLSAPSLPSFASVASVVGNGPLHLGRSALWQRTTDNGPRTTDHGLTTATSPYSGRSSNRTWRRIPWARAALARRPFARRRQGLLRPRACRDSARPG